MHLNPIQSLPDELIHKVLSFCPIGEQPDYEVICKRFAEVMRKQSLFPALCLFKKSIAVLKHQRHEFAELTLFSEIALSRLDRARHLATTVATSSFLQGMVGIPVNILLSQIPVVNWIYYPYELLGLGCIWYSPNMFALYAPLCYVGLTVEVATTHLLATDRFKRGQKATLEKEMTEQRKFLESYWKTLDIAARPQR